MNDTVKNRIGLTAINTPCWSNWTRHSPTERDDGGSNPLQGASCKISKLGNIKGVIAQLVERFYGMEEVGRSIRPNSTNTILSLREISRNHLTRLKQMA